MSVITSVGSFASKALGVAAGFADKEGNSALSDVLKNLGTATDQTLNEFNTFYQQHPVEATVALTAGVVAAVFAPELLVVGAESLGSTAYGATILAAIGGDALVGSEAVSVAATVLQDWAVSSFVESEYENMFEELNGLWDSTTDTSQSLGTVSDNSSGGYTLQLDLTGDADVTTDMTGAGTPVSEDVENSDGTSDLTTFNSDGSSETSDYSGPDGTGSLTETEQENTDGTSQITTYGSNGSTITTKYSGPNGSGIPGKTTGMLRYTDYTNNGPIIRSAGVIFDETNFVLPSVRAGDALNTTFGTIAHFIAGNLNPATRNIIDLNINSKDGSQDIFVSPTQTSVAIVCSTAGWALVTPGVYNDLSLGDSADYDENAVESLPLSYSIKIYEPAIADISYPSPSASPTYYFHVGDSASADMIFTNGAAGALTDSLEVGVGPGASAGIVESVSSSGDLAQGQSATLIVGLNTSASGYYNIDGSNFTLTSHDPDLSDVIAARSGHNFGVYVEQYASPILVNIVSGPNVGVLTNEGPNQYSLKFGYIIYDNPDENGTEAHIDIENGTSTSAQMDNLEGNISATGSGFLDSYDLPINNGTIPLESYIGAGGSITLGQFVPDVSSLVDRT